MEWVPTCSVTNDLSWAEERSTVALANYVPHVPQEADCIAELRACRLVGWPDNSSSDDEQTEEEDGEQEGDEHKEAEGQGEADPELPSSGTALEEGKTELVCHLF